MAFQCYSWIVDVYNKIIGDDEDNENSESKERLIGLPAQNICTKWQNLISWSGCGWHQKSKDGPLILRYFYVNYKLKVSIIDGRSEKQCKARGLESAEFAFFIGVCNGLALFTVPCPRRHIVFNPLSRDKITTIYGPFNGAGDACGFFFHPVAKEYRILCVKNTETEDNFEYNLYLFGQKIWRRTRIPYFSRKPSNYRNNVKRRGANPAIVNNALHWPVDRGIMVFDIISEEFSVKDLPCRGGFLAFPEHLLVKDGQLCLCLVAINAPTMHIWILKDYVNWSWTRRLVGLDWDLEMFPIRYFTNLRNSLCDIRVISIHDNKMVLFWKSRGMFCFDLDINKVWKLPLKKSRMDSHIDEPCYVHEYDHLCGFEAYYRATTVID
ncbi:hypothetical protein ABFS83_02G089500 [Erythranthe nasuta]